MSWSSAIEAAGQAPANPAAQQLQQGLDIIYKNPKGALVLFQQALQIADSTHDTRLQAGALNNIGATNLMLDRPESARQALEAAAQLYARRHDETDLADCLMNLGSICFSQHDYPTARRYTLRAIELIKGRRDSLLERNNIGLLASILVEEGKTAEAIPYFRRTLRLAELAHDHRLQVAARNSLGQAYSRLDRYSLAEDFLREALQMATDSGYQTDQAQTYQYMGEAAERRHQWRMAADHYRRSIQLGNEVPEFVREGNRRLAEVLAEVGDYQGAYAAYKVFVGLRDSLYRRETTDHLLSLDTRYRTREKEQRIREQQVDIRRKNQLAALGFGLAAAVILAAGALAWFFVQRTRANRRLAATNAALNLAIDEKIKLLTEKEALLQEKEVLVQEVHHRVKNNLQLVSSLLSWQAETNTAAAPALRQSRARLHSMALIHEHLYRAEDLARVRMDDYLGQLLRTLEAAHHDPRCPVTLTTELAPLEMEAREAIPLGLIANEILTNAYKHAFRGRTGGHLHVALLGLETTGFRLLITDDGVGLLTRHSAEALAHLPSLGVQLILTLTEQLGATYAVEPNTPTGTRFRVERVAAT